MTEQPHILVVDDDPRIRQMLSRYLEEQGLRVSVAENGPAMWSCLAQGTVDLILLDLVLPGDDGLQLARELRSRYSGIGIIMVTGRSDIVDTVVGLEVGADDYIAKPFQLREVLARIKSVLRRLQPAAAPAAIGSGFAPSEVIQFDGWTLDLARRELLAPSGAPVLLTTGDFDLLCVFVRHPGRVLDRDQIMDITRGRTWEAFDRSIDGQVARLRKKIEADPKNPVLIKSVRGAGYVFTAKLRARA